MAQILVDSYDTPEFGESITSGATWVGQSFDSGQGGVVAAVQFSLAKAGTPPGDCTAKIYAHTGTYGGGGVPTGSLLVESDVVSAASLPTTNDWITFNFSSQYSLAPNTKYCVIFSAPSITGVPNYVNIYEDSTSPSHGGNHVSSGNSGGSWGANTGRDVGFRVYVKGDDNKPGNLGRMIKAGEGISTTGQIAS